MAALDVSGSDALVLPDTSLIPDEPPAELLYRHKARFLDSIRLLWGHREIIYTLAERDFRSQYKQATLGVLWAVLSPVAMLVIFVIVFSHVSKFQSIAYQHVPYALVTFIGILCWSFFASALGTGGTSLLTNKALLAKTQFPRECFPLETMLVNAVNTALSWVPLALLFVVFGRAPALATVWAPLFIIIELVFAAGISLAISSLIIQMRDLAQVLPIIISLGLFATPVIWPFSNIPTSFRLFGGEHFKKAVVHGHQVAAHWVGGFRVNLQLVYGFINPLGPVIDNARRTMLLGLAPEWGVVGAGALGATLYLLIGYRIFKRFEVNFADIA